MKRYSCLIGILLPFQFAMAQPKNTLTIGDTIPASVYQYIQNYPALKTAVASLSGKWLILDFMSTKCGSCIEALPRFNSLQKKYDQQVQILLVSNQHTDYVNNHLKKNYFFNGNTLPVLGDDTTLSALFPHLWISHDVWIDPNGIVRAITDAQHVDDRNIRWALSEKALNLPLKVDKEEVFYDGRKPLLAPQPTSFYSALLPFNNELLRARKLEVDSATGNSRLSIVNFPLINLYRYAIGQTEHKPSQTMLQLEDTATIFYNRSTHYWTEWEKKYTYGYEATFPAGTPIQLIKKKLRHDLDTWFHFTSSYEKRMVDCYVLKESAAYKPAAVINDSTGRTLTISNMLYELNEKYFSLPAIDGRKNKTELVTGIPISALSDMEELQIRLSNYGLKLVKEPREMLILTIADVKK